jgi:NTE family protein
VSSAEPRRAIAFGAGGVLGFAWILGALKAVAEHAEFDPRESEVVIGTSAGSVAAALVGCGLDTDVIVRHHQGIPAPTDPVIDYDYVSATGGVLPPRPGWRPASPRLLLDLARRQGGHRISPMVALAGLLPAGRGTLAPVRHLVATVAEEAGFADAWPTRPRPWIVTADYRSGRRVVFGRDDFVQRPGEAPRHIRRARLADAVTASCSIPGWYPPTYIDGVPYIDGGTASNVSVDLLVGTAVEEVYVIAPMASVNPTPGRSMIERAERMVRRGVTRGMLADVARLRAAGARVYVLTPEGRDLELMGLNVMNPQNRTQLLESAHETVTAQLSRQLAGRRAALRRSGARSDQALRRGKRAAGGHLADGEGAGGTEPAGESTA